MAYYDKDDTMVPLIFFNDRITVVPVDKGQVVKLFHCVVITNIRTYAVTRISFISSVSYLRSYYVIVT